MLDLCKEQLTGAAFRDLDDRLTAARARAAGMTAWRIEGTLREFARFDPVNLWFDYPVHRLDTGLLDDLEPDSDFKALGARGAAKRWGDKEKLARDKKNQLANAFEACTMDGAVTIYAMAEYLDLKPETVKKRLRADGGYWIEEGKVGRKEPGSAG